jgi:hypothetical protein
MGSSTLTTPGSEEGPLTTDAKGEIASLRVRIEAFKKGATVSLPSTPARYDLVLDYHGKLYRAQVKYADCKAVRAQGALQLDLRKRKRLYTRDEIDVVLVYVPQIDKICWIPPELFHNRATLMLRLLPTRNGQKKGCVMAHDFIW